MVHRLYEQDLLISTSKVGQEKVLIFSRQLDVWTLERLFFIENVKILSCMKTTQLTAFSSKAGTFIITHKLYSNKTY